MVVYSVQMLGLLQVVQMVVLLVEMKVVKLASRLVVDLVDLQGQSKAVQQVVHWVDQLVELLVLELLSQSCVTAVGGTVVGVIVDVNGVVFC